MHIINLHHLTVNLGGYIVFQDLTWAIDHRDRVGLVGPNGAGKSTLLKAIAGVVVPDSGQIIRNGKLHVGYLAQDVHLPEGMTLLEAALIRPPRLAEVEAEMDELEILLGDPEVYENEDRLSETLETLQAATELYERLGGAGHRSKVLAVLHSLGFTPGDFDLPTETLSGGQKKLVALARLAMEQPEILLLDEPDNHLDMDAKQYLEAFIRDYSGGVVIVSHDRYLLDECVTHIAEMEKGKMELYAGNYSQYAMEKDLRKLRQQQAFVAQQKRIQQIEDMIHEMELKARADLNERHARQAASRRKMLARMEANGEMIERVRERRLMDFQIEGGRGSNKAIEIEKLSMAFDDDPVFFDLDLLIQHGERVGLIGPNGAGKSVLFRLILGKLDPLEGRIKIGPSTKIGYYSQEHETLERFKNRTAIELVRDIRPMPEGEAVSNLLKFAFAYDQARQPIGTLSGGERSRLQLLRLMLTQPNLLLLDEPTNNLDIASTEVLESALDDFEGAILAISHDRYFLDRVADRVVELDNGRLKTYIGGYTDYMRKKEKVRA